MANETDYGAFRLVEGNIAESRAEAIVVPCFMDFTPAPEISKAVIEKFRQYGVDEEFFLSKVKKIGEDRPQFFSAYFYPVEAAKAVSLKGIILTPIYIDKNDREEMINDIEYFFKTGISTSRALEKACKNDIDSIAFPILGAGRFGGDLEKIVPSMIDEIRGFKKLNETPSRIAIYTHDLRLYNEFKKLADWKLRKRKDITKQNSLAF